MAFSDFEIFYDALKSNFDVLQAGSLIENFLKHNKDTFSDVLEKVKTDNYNSIQLSTKAEHPEWFQGSTDRNANSKEEAMARRSQDRVRGYYYKTKDEITKSEMYRTNAKYKVESDAILEQFKQLLTGVDYFSTLFDRKCKNKLPIAASSGDELDTPRKKLKIDAADFVLNNNEFFDQICVSLCDDLGNFRCRGPWYDDSCKYRDHMINPYASRENLILFQTWNLDHQIEISRSVLPALQASIADLITKEKGEKLVCEQHKLKCTKISVINYFLELFTVKNLRLCHIVCHDKAAHDMKKSAGRLVCEKCDEYKFIEKFQAKINVEATSIKSK
jgi:DNA fragmentation factor, 40 kD, beta subunit